MKHEITIYEVEAALCKISSGYSIWANKKGIDPFRLDIYSGLVNIENPTQKLIAEKYYLPKQSVNNVVTGLVKKGMVSFKANPKDKREKIILLTKEGRSYLEECLKPENNLNKSVLKNLGKEKVEQLYKLLNEYGDELHKEIED